MEDKSEIVKYITESTENMARLQGENETLRRKVASLEKENATLSKQKITLEKVANAPVFDADRVDAIVEELGALHIIKPAYVETVAQSLKQDPSKALDLLAKFANMSMAVSSGSPVESMSSNVLDATDPDGWVESARMAS
jgi:DNA repair ATPase RecN